MSKFKSFLGALVSRIVLITGKLGLPVSSQRLVHILCRQSNSPESKKAFMELLVVLKSMRARKAVFSILIPDDMYKAFSFIRYHIKEPELFRVSEQLQLKVVPEVILLKSAFLFQVHEFLNKYEKTLYLHFKNSEWIILSCGVIDGGELFNVNMFDEVMGDAQKTIADGYMNTKFHVRPMTNDTQIIKEVELTYLPDIQAWLESRNDLKNISVLDLGGHIGSFSIQVSKKFNGDCKIHVYEPEPSNFRQIIDNINLNNLNNNIQAFNFAVSSAAGEGALYFNPEHRGANQLNSSLSYETKKISVEVITLADALLNYDEKEFPEILKIDIEGSEYDALMPVPDLVKKFRLIVGEAQKTKSHNPRELLTFLESLGFQVNATGHDDLVTFSAINKNL